MSKETRRRFDPEFREDAARSCLARDGKADRQVACDWDHRGTLGNWIARDQATREASDSLSRYDLAESRRLRAEVAELRMERDVLSAPLRFVK
jgi:transposase